MNVLSVSTAGHPTVTVIICTWNRAALLGMTLASLSQQTGIDPSAVEVLVVDNNSTDETRTVVESAALGWPLGTLRYLFEPRQGKQFALNLGVRESRHEVLAFTDDDILFPADWLQQIQALFNDRDIDLAGGKTLIDWGNAERPAWYSDALMAVLGGVDNGDTRLDPAPKTFAPGGGNLIARRATFERFGLYSETHFRHMDHEFGTRCQRLGARVVYEPAISVRAPVDERCLTPRYFLRWAFKAGMAETGGIHASGKCPEVPLWRYRRLVQDALGLVFTPSPGNAKQFFQRMRLYRDLGATSNAWHGLMSSKSHARWVEMKSQKTNGVY